MWRDAAYLLDMLLHARRVMEFCRDTSLDQFLTDDMKQAATLRVLQIIGEAASKVSVNYREEHPQIAWRQIISLRHRLVHDYPRIELPKIWSIIEHHIPPLIAALEPLVPPDSPDPT